jgi:hypothetical protein
MDRAEQAQFVVGRGTRHPRSESGQSVEALSTRGNAGTGLSLARSRFVDIADAVLDAVMWQHMRLLRGVRQ